MHYIETFVLSSRTQINKEGEEKTKSWLNQTHIIAAAISHSFK